jgi:hypothetical protein
MEEQVNETEGMNENKNEQMSMTEYFDTLKEENESLAKKVDDLREINSRTYRKVEILKCALISLKEKYSITDGDYYAALITGGNGELDIDTILYQLSK